MPKSAKKRTRTANRSRTQMPRKRRTTSRQLLARRGLIVLGIVVAASLVIAIVGTNSTTSTTPATVSSSSQGDPNALIAAATRNPNDADTVGNLADYYFQTGQYPAAQTLYQKYLQLRPDDARARTTFGELLLASGDAAGAQTQFTQAIALKPTQQTAARAHFDLGNALTSVTPPRLTDALNEFRQASDLDPSGDVGNQARTQLVQVQQQLNIATVTVIAPGGSAPAGTARPTGTP